MLDTGDNPEAPVPREMIDLEVTFSLVQVKRVNLFIGSRQES